MNNLPVESLDFDGIKTNLKNYLKSTNKFNDINFEASGIATIINLLAYNTHYIGYYTKMLLNESFIDSANLRSTLLSKAKLTGYTPKSIRAARATIKIESILSKNQKDQLLNNKLIIKPFTNFLAVTESGEKQFFNYDLYEFTMEDLVNNFRFTSPNITLYEGNLIKENFTVESASNTRFVIYNKNIDIDTLRVFVKDDINSSVQTEFILTDTLYEVTSESNVFFLSTSETGYYELIFGNGVFGKRLSIGNYVSINYLSTSGEKGNGASVFRLAGSDQVLLNEFVNFPQFVITTIDPSSSGMREESIEELKFNIPRYNSRQFRLVTIEDYKSFIMNEYRDISSINIFSSEDALPKEFNKVFVSIKPLNTRLLSHFAKQEILDKVNLLKHIGTTVVFKDPKFLDIDLVVNVKLKSDNVKNHNILKQEFLNVIQDYNKNYLNKFNNSYSDIEILNRIKKETQSIEAIYTDKKVSITLNILHDDTNEIVLYLGSNKIKKNSITSSDILFNATSFKISESLDKLYLTNSEGTYSESIGSIDYLNNQIKIKPLVNFRTGVSYVSYDSYEIKFDTLANDVFSFNDYLVNIKNVEIIL